MIIAILILLYDEVIARVWIGWEPRPESAHAHAAGRALASADRLSLGRPALPDRPGRRRRRAARPARLTSQAVLTILSVALGGGFVTSLVQAFRARPERDSIVIVPWQKLNDALGAQNARLQTDWEIERRRRQESEALLFRAEFRIDELERQLRELGITPIEPSLPPSPAPPERN
jgi:hypothetical protein